MRGHTSYNPSAPSFDPVGANSNPIGLPLVNSAIVYWFIANGRCFKVITRVNGRYDAMYAGFILSEHLPEDWSYPLFIGGSTYSRSNRASDDSNMHSNFWNPSGSNSLNTSAVTSLFVLPDAGVGSRPEHLQHQLLHLNCRTAHGAVGRHL